MKKFSYAIIACLFFFFKVSAQNQNEQIDRLKIFVDCINADCDGTFFRSEITLVDFLLDNKAADVHVLITDQGTGGGGQQYQLIFFGQNSFSTVTDTLRFSTDPNATGFEVRDQLIKYLKLGLAPYIAKTAAAKDAVIDFKRTSSGSGGDASITTTPTKDPWNYWVFNVGLNGNLRADAVYNESNVSSEASANRTTEDIKLGFYGRISQNKKGYELTNSAGGKEEVLIKNHSLRLEHYLIKSISDHWSAAYSTEYRSNTFENLKQRLLLRTSVEYNIFPYKEVNTKFFALRGYVDGRRNTYFDTTLYNQIQETLFGYGAEIELSYNQKWGTTYMGVDYHKYFMDGNFFFLRANAGIDVRITGGLSFEINTNGAIVRDQLSLPNKGATEQEVLTQRRQVASGYNYWMSFGLNYRFGSKLNNFVNPRFR